MSGRKPRLPIQRRLDVRLRGSGSGLGKSSSEGPSCVTSLPRIQGMMEMIDAGPVSKRNRSSDLMLTTGSFAGARNVGI
jgi:hypothetical protein